MMKILIHHHSLLTEFQSKFLSNIRRQRLCNSGVFFCSEDVLSMQLGLGVLTDNTPEFRKY